MEGFYVVLGTVLGFLLGLVGAEVRTSRQRSRRRIQVVRLVRTEVAVNKEKLVETLSSHREAAGKEAWALTSPFRHEAFRSCIADLPLLGDDALSAIQSLYAGLAHLERVPRDALLTLSQLYTVFRSGKKDQDDAELQERHLRQVIHAWVLEREVEALEAANRAIASLDEVIAQHKPWWQRLVGG
jgi:hypothetical protein